MHYIKIWDLFIYSGIQTINNVNRIYLIPRRYYLLLWTVLSWVILAVLQSTYTFSIFIFLFRVFSFTLLVIPPVFAIKYVTEYLWVLRFRILTAQLVCLTTFPHYYYANNWIRSRYPSVFVLQYYYFSASLLEIRRRHILIPFTLRSMYWKKI